MLQDTQKYKMHIGFVFLRNSILISRQMTFKQCLKKKKKVKNVDNYYKVSSNTVFTMLFKVTDVVTRIT